MDYCDHRPWLAWPQLFQLTLGPGNLGIPEAKPKPETDDWELESTTIHVVLGN